MSGTNAYSFDFLRREHTLNDDGEPSSLPIIDTTIASPISDGNHETPDIEALAAAAANKPDLEKQFDIINFLQKHRVGGHLTPAVIYQRTGIDLEEDLQVAEMLKSNSKVRTEEEPDPDNPSLMITTYAYRAIYPDIKDRVSLLAEITKTKNGIRSKDLEDSYIGVKEDLDALICGGDVIAISNTEDKDKMIFSRGESFLVEIDGVVNVIEPEINMMEEQSKIVHSNGIIHTGETNNATLPPTGATIQGTIDLSNKQESGETSTQTMTGDDPNKPNNLNVAAPTPPPVKPQIFSVETDIDPTTQIRRGEAVQIGGQWFRVSSAVREGSLDDQPVRARAPLSVVMLTDLPKRNEQDGYIRPFNESTLPCDASLAPGTLNNLKKAKEARERLFRIAHGRTGGVASQLLGSHAHSSNPIALAASFGTASTSTRKRPNKTNTMNAAKIKQDAIKAKEAASDPYLSLYSHARRHGCTLDVREMYRQTRTQIPESDVALKKMLLEHKLLEPGEEMRRARLAKRSNLNNDGKPVKRRYYERKNQRLTNTHLEGTEIGAILRQASEKQKQGKTVGDGGM